MWMNGSEPRSETGYVWWVTMGLFYISIGNSREGSFCKMSRIFEAFGFRIFTQHTIR